MPRGDGLTKQFELFWLLQEQREFSVEELAERLECTRRTVYRYLDVMQRWSMPLYQERTGKRVRWRLLEGSSRTLSVQLSLYEVMALVAAEHLLSGLSGTVFAESAKSGVTKLKSALAPPLRAKLESLTQSLAATGGPRRNLTSQRARLATILEATASAQLLQFKYKKLGAARPSTYTVEPHHVHVHGTSVYVVGWVRERRAARIFLLDRVSDVAVLPQAFERRSDLLPGAFAQGAFGLWEGPVESVILRFRGTAARIVAEQQFHPTQQVSWSGSEVTMTMRLPLSPSFVAWVRGFSNRVEVIGPNALRKLV